MGDLADQLLRPAQSSGGDLADSLLTSPEDRTRRQVKEQLPQIHQQLASQHLQRSLDPAALGQIGGALVDQNKQGEAIYTGADAGASRHAQTFADDYANQLKQQYPQLKDEDVAPLKEQYRQHVFNQARDFQYHGIKQQIRDSGTIGFGKGGLFGDWAQQYYPGWSTGYNIGQGIKSRGANERWGNNEATINDYIQRAADEVRQEEEAKRTTGQKIAESGLGFGGAAVEWLATPAAGIAGIGEKGVQTLGQLGKVAAVRTALSPSTYAHQFADPGARSLLADTVSNTIFEGLGPFGDQGGKSFAKSFVNGLLAGNLSEDTRKIIEGLPRGGPISTALAGLIQNDPELRADGFNRLMHMAGGMGLLEGVQHGYGMVRGEGKAPSVQKHIDQFVQHMAEMGANEGPQIPLNEAMTREAQAATVAAEPYQQPAQGPHPGMEVSPDVSRNEGGRPLGQPAHEEFVTPGGTAESANSAGTPNGAVQGPESPPDATRGTGSAEPGQAGVPGSAGGAEGGAVPGQEAGATGEAGHAGAAKLPAAKSGVLGDQGGWFDTFKAEHQKNLDAIPKDLSGWQRKAAELKARRDADDAATARHGRQSWFNTGTKFDEEGGFVAKDGKRYSITSDTEKDGATRASVRDENGNEVSHVTFVEKGDNEKGGKKLAGSYAETDKAHQGLGLASALYDAAESSGHTIHPSDTYPGARESRMEGGLKLWHNNAEKAERARAARANARGSPERPPEPDTSHQWEGAFTPEEPLAQGELAKDEAPQKSTGIKKPIPESEKMSPDELREFLGQGLIDDLTHAEGAEQINRLFGGESTADKPIGEEALAKIPTGPEPGSFGMGAAGAGVAGPQPSPASPGAAALTVPERGEIKPQPASSWFQAAKDFLKSFGQQSFPALTRLSRESGEKLAASSNAKQAAMSSWDYFSNILKVGEKRLADMSPEDRRELGSTWLEYRMRKYRDYLDAQGEDSSKVRTLVGQNGSPIKDEAQFQENLKGLQPFFEAVKQEWTPEVNNNYRGLKGLDPNDAIDTPSQIADLPINAIALKPDDIGQPGAVSTGARQSMANLKIKRPGFTRQAELSAPAYDVDIAHMMQRTLDVGIEAARRAEFVRQAIDDKVISKVSGGEKAPEGFKYLGLDPAKGLAGLDANARYYVHPDAYKDVVQGLGIGERPGQTLFSGLRGITDKVYNVALMSPVELATHAANHITALFRPGMGIPILNLKDSFKNAWDLYRKDPEMLRKVKDLAEISASFGHEAKAGILGEGLAKYDPTAYVNRFTSGLIDTMQKAVRVQLGDAYDRMARAGHFPDTDTGKRDFVNQALGNYNTQAGNRITQFLKDTGLQSFATAAHTFTTQGVKSLWGGAVNAPTNVAANQLQLRAVAIVKLLPFLAMGPVINYLKTGQAFPKNIPAFSIQTRDDDEKSHYFDPLAFTGLRRGARMTGVNALVEGKLQDKSAGQVGDMAVRDAFRSLEHLFAGPPAQLVHTAMTGENAMGRRVAAKAKPGESQYLENFKAAARGVNPIVSSATEEEKHPRTFLENVMQSAGPFGEKSRGIKKKR